MRNGQVCGHRLTSCGSGISIRPASGSACLVCASAKARSHLTMAAAAPSAVRQGAEQAAKLLGRVLGGAERKHGNAELLRPCKDALEPLLRRFRRCSCGRFRVPLPGESAVRRRSRSCWPKPADRFAGDRGRAAPRRRCGGPSRPTILRVSSSAPSKSLMIMTAASCRARRCACCSALFSIDGDADMPRPTPSDRLGATIADQDLQHRRAAAPRPELGQPAIVEHDGADAIACAKDAPGADRRGLGGRDRLHRPPAAEEHRQPLVDDQQRLPVALLVEDPDMRLLQPRGHLPVDRADVVARAIVADLLEVQPTAPHARREAAGQQAVHRLARQERDPASRGIRARADRRD